jgi:AcrR family transcriptional regulator
MMAAPAGMPKVTEEYREARRAQILAAARRCFLRKGFQETSMAEILAEAGVSSGALYNYFSSKEEMIVAIAKDNIGEVISVLRESATGPHRSSPGAALANVLDVGRARHIDNGSAAMSVMVWSEALRNPALAAQVAALGNEMRRYFGGLATDVRLPEGVSADSCATVLGSISAGFIVLLAIFGPDAAEDLPATVRAPWPADKAS